MFIRLNEIVFQQGSCSFKVLFKSSVLNVLEKKYFKLDDFYLGNLKKFKYHAVSLNDYNTIKFINLMWKLINFLKLTLGTAAS